MVKKIRGGGLVGNGKDPGCHTSVNKNDNKKSTIAQNFILYFFANLRPTHLKNIPFELGVQEHTNNGNIDQQYNNVDNHKETNGDNFAAATGAHFDCLFLNSPLNSMREYYCHI